MACHVRAHSPSPTHNHNFCSVSLHELCVTFHPISSLPQNNPSPNHQRQNQPPQFLSSVLLLLLLLHVFMCVCLSVSCHQLSSRALARAGGCIAAILNGDVAFEFPGTTARVVSIVGCNMWSRCTRGSSHAHCVHVCVCVCVCSAVVAGSCSNVCVCVRVLLSLFQILPHRVWLHV